MEVLRGAAAREIIDAETLAMMEGALAVSEIQVRDIMVPKTQVDFICIDEPPEVFLPLVVETQHSRFPVLSENEADVLGILLAKDLLRFLAEGKPVVMQEVMRKPLFIPECQHISNLLREFRRGRYHLAVVVDEYGAISGIVTIEDVLEQIVGSIADEYDVQVPKILEEEEGGFLIAGDAPLAEVKDRLALSCEGEEESLGDFLRACLHRPPERGDRVSVGGWVFTITQVQPKAGVFVRALKER